MNVENTSCNCLNLISSLASDLIVSIPFKSSTNNELSLEFSCITSLFIFSKNGTKNKIIIP